jgi:chromosome segregation ATPase
MTFRKCLGTAVLTLSTALALPAMAQTSGSRSNTNQNTASQTAGKQVQKAQADVNKIQAELNKIRAKVRTQVLAKPEWTQVGAQKKTAEANLAVARKNALSVLGNKADYKALAKEREDAQQVVNAFNAAGSQVTQADFDKASTTLVTNGYAMKKMESDTLKEDPKYSEASAQLDAANAKMKEADSQVEIALKDDQEYQNAFKQLETAKNALTTAKAQVAQARQQEEQARAQQAKSRQDQQNSGSGR